MRARIVFVVAALLAGLSLLSWTGPVSADDAIPPVKMAVCDPIKILNQIQEGKDVMAKWKQDEQTLSNQVNLKKGELQTKQDELKLLLPTSDEYQKKVEALTSAQADTQAWLQATQVNMARRQREQEKDMFDKILKAVSDVAQAQGVTLVVNGAHADFPDLDHLDANAFVQTILLHATLYSDPKLDITQQVIIAMDKAYTNGAAHP